MRNKMKSALGGKKTKGFTLIELVVVMAIIAVLAVLIIAAIQAARRAATETQNRGNARTVETAMEAFATRNNGRFSTAVNGQTFFTALSTAGGPLDPFVNQWQVGTCANGGGTITVPNDQTFTLTIFNADCNGTPNIGTIVH